MPTRVFPGIGESIMVAITAAAITAGGWILVTEGHSVTGWLAIVLGVLVMYFYIKIFME